MTSLLGIEVKQLHGDVGRAEDDPVRYHRQEVRSTFSYVAMHQSQLKSCPSDWSWQMHLCSLCFTSESLVERHAPHQAKRTDRSGQSQPIPATEVALRPTSLSFIPGKTWEKYQKQLQIHPKYFVQVSSQNLIDHSFLCFLCFLSRVPCNSDSPSG